MSIISAIVLFGFLIFIHELGHFLAAKWSGVKVLKFSLGFGPRLIGRKVGETDYVISAIPLGGYVKMLGQEDIGEATDDADSAEKERSFRHQPGLKKALIIIAGPLFNIFTAAAIFFFIFLAGVPTLLPVVGEVMPDTPAAKAALSKGDIIKEVNGAPITQWTDMTTLIRANPHKALALKVLRNGEPLQVSITPEIQKVPNIFGEVEEVGVIGITPSGATTTVKEGLGSAAVGAVVKTWDIIEITIVGIVKLIQRIIPADTIGGPILIFQLAEKQASAGPMSFFLFAAVISINLGILNLLPVPVLDGGHILLLGIEAVKGKPLSETAVLVAQRIGLALLIMLMLFAFYNDIFRIISGKPLP